MHINDGSQNFLPSLIGINIGIIIIVRISGGVGNILIASKLIIGVSSTDRNIDRRGKEVLNSQAKFEELARGKSRQLAEKEHADIFIPITAQSE